MGKNSQNSEVRRINGKTAAALVITAIAVIVLFAFVVSYKVTDVFPAAVGAVLLYVLISAGFYFLFEVRPSRNGEKLKPVMGTIMFEAVVKMATPVFICDSSEKIVWSNTSTEEIVGKKNLYGSTVNETFGVSLDDIRRAPEGNGAVITVGGRSFTATYHHIKSDYEDFSLILTTEKTELDRMQAEADGNELAVCYIIIDNLGEMLQYDSEQYRPAAALIDDTLRAWADEYGAILKEYERDKYFLVTRAEMLDRMIASKFDILDRVRDVKVGDTSLPLTVSIGISAIRGSYEEKEKAAHAALDLALQRGGDQAAVKGEESVEIFGGITKSVQKKTNVRARVVVNELMTEMKNSSNVLIMGHKRADFDAFGSCVGLAKLAMFCGADVKIIIDKADRNLIECRNLLNDEDEYRGMFITAQEGLDRLETETLVILSDVNNINICEEPELAKRTDKLVVIDHHRKMNEFEKAPDIEYIDPSASSASELVAEMLEQALSRDGISANEANVMLAGITLDTKQFTKNTGTRTFSVAVYLRDKGADPTVIKKLFRESFDDYMREAMFRRNVEIYRGEFAIAVADDENIDRVIAAKAADSLLNVEGMKASFAIIRDGATVHISARSAGEVNVQLIMEGMGGGGHFDGAAVQFTDKTVEEAVAELKASIDSIT